MNNIIIQFFLNNWLLIILIIFLIIPLIPPEKLSFRSTFIDDGKPVKSLKISLLETIVHLILRSVSRLIIDISVHLHFQTSVSLIIFTIIAVDIYYRKQISESTIILVIVGILALYSQQLVDKGKSLKIWKIFEWESK